MKTTNIPFVSSLQFNPVPTLELSTYKWLENGYEPKVEVFLCHDGGRLAVKFVAHELAQNIRAEVTEDAGPVNEDSCVEFFFNPYADDPRYINIEINSIGTLNMSIRTDRASASPIAHICKPKMNISNSLTATAWTTEYILPFELISELFSAPRSLSSGSVCKGNFYKCGDFAKLPHYGMWNEVLVPDPDFHRPDFFASLVFD
ncbi:MAG: carbohydrate-binding family 9-like protein [Bacillota bacterium]